MKPKRDSMLGGSVMANRRRFLLAIGAGALATRLSRSKAWAAGDELPPRPTPGAEPLRFIGVFAPHGCAHELWKPGPHFDLKYDDCSLSPFDSPEQFGRSFKEQLLVIDGLDLAAGIEMGTVGHDASRVILTGSGVTGKNASIDQFLAVDRMLGADTPHTSVTLAVGNERTELGSNISYGRGGIPTPKWIDPERVFDELFGAPLSKEGKVQAEQQRRRRASVLDFVREDLASLAERVPVAERDKMEQHATALREIEKRLLPMQRQCAAPPRPQRAAFPRLEAYGGGEAYFETITHLMVDMLARAMACDLTRFATLMLGDLSRTDMYPGYPVDVHQAVAHRYFAHTNKGKDRPETWKALALQNRHSYAQVARLLQRLDEAGILGDCCVLVQSDMGDPARHSSRNIPTVLAGGCGGRLSMGRYIDVRTAKSEQYYPNNRLLVSLCQVFGVPISRFGSSPNSKTLIGEMPELRARLG